MLEGPNGRRQVKADGFFQGTYMTDMAEDEILAEIRVPAFAPKTGSAYEKLKRKTGDWATAAAAVVLRIDGGVVSHARIALTNVAPTALRATDAEAALLGKPLSAATIADAAAKADGHLRPGRRPARRPRIQDRDGRPDGATRHRQGRSALPMNERAETHPWPRNSSP